jgi:hypothetical protein
MHAQDSGDIAAESPAAPAEEEEKPKKKKKKKSVEAS